MIVDAGGLAAMMRETLSAWGRSEFGSQCWVASMSRLTTLPFQPALGG